LRGAHAARTCTLCAKRQTTVRLEPFKTLTQRAVWAAITGIVESEKVVYDETIHAPLLFKLPGSSAGERSNPRRMITATNVLLGRVLELSGEYEAALPKLKKAAVLEPKEAEPHVFLTERYVRL